MCSASLKSDLGPTERRNHRRENQFCVFINPRAHNYLPTCCTSVGSKNHKSLSCRTIGWKNGGKRLFLDDNSKKNLPRCWFSCQKELKNPAWFHLQRADFPPLGDEVKHVTCRAAIFDPPGGAERKMEEKTHRSGRMRNCRQGDKKQRLTSMGGFDSGVF